MKRIDQWISFGKKSNRNLFFYEDKVLDLTSFMVIHPGGKKALANYQDKDITKIIFTVYPHNKETTLKTLKKYVIGKIPEEEIRLRQKVNRSRSVTPLKDKKRVCFQTQAQLRPFQKKQSEECNKSTSKKIGKANQSESKQSSKQKKKKGPKQKSKSKEKQSRKAKQNHSKQQNQNQNGSNKQINEDFDEQKPVFKVPILYTKNIFFQ